MRAVAGKGPANFERGSVQVAPHMGAGGGVAVDDAILAAIGGNLLEALADDGALARLQLVDRGKLAGGDVLGKVLERGRVLGDEISRGDDRNARRLVELLPRAGALGDQIRNQ